MKFWKRRDGPALPSWVTPLEDLGIEKVKAMLTEADGSDARWFHIWHRETEKLNGS